MNEIKLGDHRRQKLIDPRKTDVNKKTKIA